MKLHSGIVSIKDHLSKYYWHKENKSKIATLQKMPYYYQEKQKINDVLQSLKQMSVVESGKLPIVYERIY
ncbi:MAG: hypothetical protein IPN80_00735 [Flavobacterium sp.]|nr:hypothetical protein [Flavobacterium sp.]